MEEVEQQQQQHQEAEFKVLLDSLYKTYNMANISN